jgi:transcriptional regulator with XRE-family HTH domain
MQLKDRLKVVFDTQNISQKKFSDILGIGQSTLNNYLTGVSEPNFKNIKLLATAFPNLNINWLLTGEGGMYIDISIESLESIEILNRRMEGIEDSPPQYEGVNDIEYLKQEIKLLERLCAEKDEVIQAKNQLISHLLNGTGLAQMVDS